jgi:hypothetical protein
VATKADLLTAWTRWTATPEKLVRQRVHELSDAGLLPYRSHPISAVHLAQFLLAELAADPRIEIGIAMRDFGAFRCAAPPADDALGLGGENLLDAIIQALKPPLVIRRLEVSPTERTAKLTVGRTLVSTAYVFTDPSPPVPEPDIHPIAVTRRIDQRLVQKLLPLLQPEAIEGVA